MTKTWETSLPQSLQNEEDLKKIELFVKHWSKLVAWSWTDLLAFAGDTNKEYEERALKQSFSRTLQAQCQLTNVYESYADGDAPEKAGKKSTDLKSLLEDKISDPEKVTLPNVFKKLNDGEDFVCTQYPDFSSLFTYRVRAAYTGTITDVSDTNEIGGIFDRKYVAYLAYPPRPALSEYTVTEQQLRDWATKPKPNPSPEKEEYLPPSVYIPIAGT
jgi:hypothetical protein